MGEAHGGAAGRTSEGVVVLLALLSMVIAMICWLLWGNLTVGTTNIEIESARLPREFDRFTIAQVSDLHNAEFGENNEELIRILGRAQPDMIAITGDLVDLNHTNLDVAVGFAKQAAQVAPCYFVMGNHEAWLDSEYDFLEEQLIIAGVRVLHNQALTVNRNGAAINLLGIDDPEQVDVDAAKSGVITDSELDSIERAAGFTILLAHRPEHFSKYVAHEIDLVLSGHAHGGQVRIPFVGGLVAPDQGFFPRYDAGLYQQGHTSMVVSRGLGNSVFPIRVNNRPEIVLIELHAKR